MTDEDQRLRDALSALGRQLPREAGRSGQELLDAARVRARGRRISVAGGAVAVAAVIAIVISGFASLFIGPQIHFPATTPASNAKPFAIWPEDTREEARVACLERAGEETWRLDANETADRFVRDVLGYQNADIPLDQPPLTQDSTNLVVYDDKMTDLGTVLHLRRFGSCWFVTFVGPREGFPTATFAYLKGRSVAMANYGAGPADVANVELGFGESAQSVTVKGGKQLVFDVDSTGPGHYLVTYPNFRQWGQEYGEPLGPPLKDDYLGKRTRGEGYAIWPESSEKASEAKCDRAQKAGEPRVQGKNEQTLRGEPWRKAPDTLLTWFVSGLRSGYLEPGYFYGLGPYELVQGSDPLRWQAVADNGSLPTLEIELREVEGGCYAVKSVRTPEQPVNAKVWADRDRVSFDLSWAPRATDVQVFFTLGNNGTGGAFEKDPRLLPFSIGATDLPEGKPGTYSIYLRRGERLVAVESRTIGPMEFPTRSTIP